MWPIIKHSILLYYYITILKQQNCCMSIHFTSFLFIQITTMIQSTPIQDHLLHHDQSVFSATAHFFNYLLEAHTHGEQVKPYHVVILVLQLVHCNVKEFTNFQANASKIFRIMLLDMQVCEYIIIYKYIANNNIQRYGEIPYARGKT